MQRDRSSPRGALVIAVAATLPFAIASCHSPGPYGHAKIYATTSDEQQSVAGSDEYDALLAARDIERVRKRAVSLFGVVTQRGSGPGGAAYVELSIRALQPRNLCDSDDEDSCRVTVSERDMGRVHVLMNPEGDDNIGQYSIGLGSLLRVVGTVSQDVDPHDGTPIVRARFYRHWPRGSYVTTKAAATMRR